MFKELLERLNPALKPHQNLNRGGGERRVYLLPAARLNQELPKSLPHQRLPLLRRPVRRLRQQKPLQSSVCVLGVD